MSVDVDKARRDQFSLGVDLFLALTGDLADLADAPSGDGDIGFEQFAAEPVGDGAAADHEVWMGRHGVHPEFCVFWRHLRVSPKTVNRRQWGSGMRRTCRWTALGPPVACAR